MAKRFLACFMALFLLAGTAMIVGCGDGDKTPGLSAEDIEKKKAELKAKEDAVKAATTTAPK